MTLANRLAPLSQARLRSLARGMAARPDVWQAQVRYDPHRRWYRRLAWDVDHEIWLLSWLPGQYTGFHDHGRSAGVLAVVSGVLCERMAVRGRPRPGQTILSAGSVRSFGPQYIHDVRNASEQPAVSIHVYSPPLIVMRRYGVAADGLLRPAVAVDR